MTRKMGGRIMWWLVGCFGSTYFLILALSNLEPLQIEREHIQFIKSR